MKKVREYEKKKELERSKRQLEMEEMRRSEMEKSQFMTDDPSDPTFIAQPVDGEWT